MKNLRHYTLMLLIVALCTVLPLTAGAASSTASTSVNIKTQSVSLKFDGQSLLLPEGQYAFLYKDRTYIPIRFISYALQKSVKWDEKTSKVTVSEPTAAEKESLAKLLAGAAAGGKTPEAGKSLTIKPVQATLVFDGVQKSLPTDQSLYYYKGTIYVPVRFLSEAVGTDIKWDQKTNSITGESAAYKAAQGGGVVTPPAGGSGEETGGGTVPVEETKPTKDEIIEAATAKLDALESKCYSSLFTLYTKYQAATDETVKADLKASGQQTVSKCQTDFEKVISDTETKLTKYGYDTAIIAEYEDYYQKQLDKVYEAAEDLD